MEHRTAVADFAVEYKRRGSNVPRGSCDGKLYRFYRCPHHRKDARQRCTCGQISASKIEEAAAEQIRRLGKNPRIVESIARQLPMLASYNVPALLAKAPNLISHIPDAAMKELFRLVYKRIAFNPVSGAFQAECHNI